MGELSDAQLREIFRQRIRPQFDRTGSFTHAESAPTVVLLGGQPGSGKSRAVGRVKAQYPGIVPVVGDDLRAYHPDYDRLMREDPLSMPRETGQAASRWARMAMEYLREQRRSALVETTLRQPDMVREVVTEFRQAGYRIELRVVAVPLEVSRLGTIARYADQVERSGAGRWAVSTVHDTAAAAVPGTASDVVKDGMIDHVTIESRQGEVYLETSLRPQQWTSAALDVRLAIDAAREPERLPAAEARAWLETATTSVQTCVRSGQSDSDLLATVGRMVDRDAPRVARAAYPGDERAQRQALERLREANRPLAKRALGHRINAEVRRRGDSNGRDVTLGRDGPTPGRSRGR